MGSGPGTRGRGGGAATLSSESKEEEEEAPSREEKFGETFGETTKGEVESLDRSLSELEIEALSHYQGDGYENINGFLRGQENLYTDNEKYLENLNNIFDVAELSKDATFYRWTSGTHLEGVTVGSVMRDPAFLSTSRSYSATSHFGDTALIIRAKKGDRVVDVDKHSTYTMDEYEVLFDKGTKLRVTSITKHSGNTHIFAETID